MKPLCKLFFWHADLLSGERLNIYKRNRLIGFMLAGLILISILVYRGETYPVELATLWLILYAAFLAYLIFRKQTEHQLIKQEMAQNRQAAKKIIKDSGIKNPDAHL